MPLFSIDITARNMSVVKPTTFEGQGIQEPRDLRPLLAANLEKLDPDSNWFLLSEEFSGWEGSNRAIDILAVVRDGDEAHLVVIELKRTEDGGHMDLQAIRYAAMVAPFSFEDLVRIHADYLKRLGKPSDGARVALLQHLGAEVEGIISVSNRPRIVLVSWGFSREISATVLWLNSVGMDIRCFAAQPYQIQSSLYLDVEQVIPLRSAQEYEFRLRDKQIQKAEADSQKIANRKENVFVRLEKAGVLVPGTQLVLLPYQSYLDSVPDNVKKATFQSRGFKGIIWAEEPDGEGYSLQRLTDKIFTEYAKTPTKQNPTALWAVEGQTKSLWDIAEELANAGDVAPAVSGAVPTPVVPISTVPDSTVGISASANGGTP